MEIYEKSRPPPYPNQGKTICLGIILQYIRILRIECVRMDIWRFQK